MKLPARESEEGSSEPCEIKRRRGLARMTCNRGMRLPKTESSPAREARRHSVAALPRIPWLGGFHAKTQAGFSIVLAMQRARA
ncbi:hypothetical protein RPD_3926 [Rhodopseudomonas palustris BisB5]|uniref:Uncharacterized protein n=1 Tax=Rhodopseudomonas palustris (strain BisB5) TaxID=316057 RepID=Q131U2_RHOPS|nr:hypothetical protein RPD_3926 [Rhodopseudomonas palustris BisB5]